MGRKNWVEGSVQKEPFICIEEATVETLISGKQYKKEEKMESSETPEWTLKS